MEYHQAQKRPLMPSAVRSLPRLSRRPAEEITILLDQRLTLIGNMQACYKNTSAKLKRRVRLRAAPVTARKTSPTSRASWRLPPRVSPRSMRSTTSSSPHGLTRTKSRRKRTTTNPPSPSRSTAPGRHVHPRRQEQLPERPPYLQGGELQRHLVCHERHPVAPTSS